MDPCCETDEPVQHPRTTRWAYVALLCGVTSALLLALALVGYPIVLFHLCFFFIVAGVIGFIVAAVRVTTTDACRGMRPATAGLGITIGVACLLLAISPPVQKVREPSFQIQAQNHMRQVLIGLHTYHDIHKRFPPPASSDKDGRPLLSWRVAILPHLEQEALYREFKLDEPWDSPHNINLLDRMPYLFESPQLGKPAGPNRTHFQLVVGRGAAFDDPFAIVRLQNGFPDGTGTILMVEAARPVPWTKPEDFSFHPDESLPPLGGSFLVDSDWFGSRRQEGFHMRSASAEMFFVRLPVDEGKLRWGMLRNDGKGWSPD